MSEFITIKETSQAEIVEKMSKFIANVYYIENKEEAEEILKNNKKKYYDARHNCYSYRVLENGNIIEKSSDDGEPSGTAGAPMLAILKGNNLCNILVIVTRYFGGILLGTGGLVKAYSEAINKVIEKSEKISKTEGIEFEIKIDYQNLEKFKHYCKTNNIIIENIEFQDVAICNIVMEIGFNEQFSKDFENKMININEKKILSNKFVEKSIIK